jgi:hypothetical protein
MAEVAARSMYDWLRAMDSIPGTYEVADDPYRRLLAMRNVDLDVTFILPLTLAIDRPKWGLRNFPSHLIKGPDARKKLAHCLTTGEHDIDWTRRVYLATVEADPQKPIHAGEYRLCRSLAKDLDRFRGVALLPSTLEQIEGHLVYWFGHVGEWEVKPEIVRGDTRRVDLYFLGDPSDLVRIEREDPPPPQYLSGMLSKSER